MSLQLGDRVLFYTDGLVEARSSSGERFGVDRLADLLVRESLAELETAELLRRVLDAVMAYRAAPLQDDATAVILEWTSAGRAVSAGRRGVKRTDPSGAGRPAG